MLESVLMRAFLMLYVNDRLRITSKKRCYTSCLANPWRLSVRLSLCWPQCVQAGVWLWLVGHSQTLLTGSDTSWENWLNVSALPSHFDFGTIIIPLKRLQIIQTGAGCLLSRLLYKQITVSSLLAIFTARCYASAVLAMALCPPSVCLSVRPSVTSRSCTKTAKRRITQTTPHDSPGSLVFRSQRSPRNSTGVTPYGGAKCRWGGSKNRRLSTNNRLYLENGTR